MFLIGVIAIISAGLVLVNMQMARKRERFVVPDKPSLHFSAVQIICGDCGGEGIIPVKTFMDRHGHCERCGGGSYILASDRGMYARRLFARGLTVVPNEMPDRVQPEAVPQHLEPVPQMKIAV